MANVETRAGVDGYQPLDWNTQNDTACPACVFFGIEGYSRAGKRIAGTRKHGLLHTTQSWFITRRTSPHLTQPSRADNNAVSSAMLQDSSHDMNAMIGIAHHDSMEAPLAPRLVNPHINNFSDIKRWNDRCQQNHQRSCGASCPPVAMPQGFALLDCSTHQIISLAHAVPYVALSYVWGTKSSCKAEDDLPLTIRDAMTVSEELGYKYLCKYCACNKPA